MFRGALNLRAALTSNSGNGGVKGEQRTENREQRRHARCLNSCALLRSPRVEGDPAA